MEPEPLLAPAAAAEADMTIDYDQPQQAVAGAADDAMGIEVPVTAPDDPPSFASTASTAQEPHTEDLEAIMQDEEGDGVVAAAARHETEILMVEEADDSALPGPGDVPFASAEDQVAPGSIGAEGIPDEEPAASVTVVALADTTFTPEPVLATDEIPTPIENLAAAQPVDTEEATATAGAENETPVTDTLDAAVGHDDSAAGALDQSETSPPTVENATGIDQRTVAEDTVDAPAGEQAGVGESNEVAEPPQLEPTIETVPPLFAIATEKLSEQLPEVRAAEAAPENALHVRPPVDKDPLLQVQLPAELFPEASTSTSRLAPGVFLTCGGTTYCLFRQLRIASESSLGEDEEGGGEFESHSDEVDAPLVLAALAHHALYYEPVEKLVQSLRESLPELNGEADELVLDFEDLGITIGEDNCYARNVSLFDFDRLQLGCQIPNRLHARIYAQPRFASGFNALAQHIASTYSPASASSLVDDHAEEETEREGEEVEVEVEEHAEDEDIADERNEEHEEEGSGVADDYDGPDSELPLIQVTGGAEEVEGNGTVAEDDDKDDDDGGDDGDDEEDDDDDNDNDDFDLESALAQLDQDSIVAVVEGAQEDLLLEPGEDSVPVPAETVAVAGAEGVGAGEAERDEGAEEQVEEADGISQDDQNWALVETEEIVEVVATAVEVEERAGGAAGMVVPEGGRGAGEGAGEEGEVAEVGDEPGPSAATLAVPEADEINTRREDEHGGSADLTVIAEAEPVVQETIEQVSAAADRVAQDITSATAASAEPAGPEDREVGAEPSDVVIDYDEAFEPAVAVAPTATPAVDNVVGDASVAEGGTANGLEQVAAPPSPKRSRSFDAVEGGAEADEDLAADAKRPRLSEAEVAELAATATA